MGGLKYSFRAAPDKGRVEAASQECRSNGATFLGPVSGAPYRCRELEFVDKINVFVVVDLLVFTSFTRVPP